MNLGVIKSAYLAAEGFQHQLAWELKRKNISVFCWHGRLALSRDNPIRAVWALDTWIDPKEVVISSISSSCKFLKSIQRNWSPYVFRFSGRMKLIQDTLPFVKGAPLIFPCLAPIGHLGAWTLVTENTILYSRHKSSSFINGEVNFIENKVEPPSRAYLKLWEALTRFGKWPSANETCVDLGASPGGWTWVAASLGAKVLSVDRSELDPKIASMPNVIFIKGNAFDYPVEEVDWLLCDVICHPQRVLDLVTRWIAAKSGPKYIICTIKLKGRINDNEDEIDENDSGVSAMDSCMSSNMEDMHKVVDMLESIPNGKVCHLHHNKHEVTFMWNRK